MPGCAWWGVSSLHNAGRFQALGGFQRRDGKGMLTTLDSNNALRSSGYAFGGGYAAGLRRRAMASLAGDGGVGLRKIL